jgi:hypothetical protein
VNDAEREAHAIGRRARRLVYCVGRRHQERLTDYLVALAALADAIDADHVAAPAGMLIFAQVRLANLVEVQRWAGIKSRCCAPTCDRQRSLLFRHLGNKG